MFYKTSAFSFPGPRKENQDFYITQPLDGERHVICIADGVGGRKGGAEASKTAVSVVKNTFLENTFTTMSALFNNVHQTIINYGNANNLPEMATTLTVVYIDGNHITVGHVGDCRLYHLRGCGIITKTHDQSEKQKLIDDGVLSRERALHYHRKNILLSVIASDKQYELFETKFQTASKDRLLLVSDGVYNICTKKELLTLSQDSSNVNKWIDKISFFIQNKEVKDDYTAIALEFID
ncbi:protein phosphatase 2C domain-containing protein [uncultured Enterobacter sp.]|uniref:PP2C family protein-serine/threonine phosphatase n=1 Tax=uncultured Enterobacter sp. TaxID=238202 RepID=UPI0025900D4B|nr:protein phosphatase 2C domain-containing protein [uncultured Enterobacter sp.]